MQFEMQKTQKKTTKQSRTPVKKSYFLKPKFGTAFLFVSFMIMVLLKIQLLVHSFRML